MSDMTSDTEFYEDDEPVEKILDAFERGQKGITARPVRGWTRYLSVSRPGHAGFLPRITIVSGRVAAR
jgi:hypothetical protein